MRTPQKLGLLALSVLVLGLAPSCDFVQDRFRDCRQLKVDLVNAQFSLGQINLLAEHEPVNDETLLVPGASRRVLVCAERGDRKRFFAAKDGQFVGVVNCVVTKDPHELESSLARVLWGLQGLSCEDW